jgi:hypothetical protein
VTASFAVSELSGIESMEYVSPFNGNKYPVALQDGVLTETFRPGEGKLYKLNGLLTRKVLPIQRNPARLILETPEVAELVGLDVTFSADTDMKASTLQVTTNKRFPEEKTLFLDFDHDPADEAGSLDKGTPVFPKNGKVRFDPYLGKHIRFTVHDEASWYNYGYAEVRVRFAGEPELEDTAEAEAEVIYYDDVDFTALDKALTAFEALDEADYTAESWHAAKNFYDAAVAMKDGTYPQNAVTVAAWKLEDSIKELAPAPKAEKVAPPAAKNSRLKLPELKSIKMDKGIVAVAIATLAGAVTGAVAGVITSLKKKN